MAAINIADDFKLADVSNSSATSLSFITNPLEYCIKFLISAMSVLVKALYMYLGLNLLNSSEENT
jgi:hypothetical protein